MTTATTTTEAQAFLAAVGRELDDLPDEERAGLLEDLSSHLSELSGQPEEVPLGIRLGPPAEYAAELRSAAGLPPRPQGGSAPPRLRRSLSDVLARSAAAGLATRARRHPWSRQALALLAELRPAWWVLRGYLVVALPALWWVNANDDFPLPTIFGSGILGAMAVIAAVVASVRVGRRRLAQGGRPLVLVLDVALALGALSLLAQSGLRTQPVHHDPSSAWSGYELESRYGPVTNIYPYTAQGEPLEDVLLFDQDGRPLRAELQQWWPDQCRRIPDHPRAADGVAVPWAYPYSYVPAEGTASARCDSAPAPSVPLPTFEDH